jgi:hypothetical protein
LILKTSVEVLQDAGTSKEAKKPANSMETGGFYLTHYTQPLVVKRLFL